MGEAGVAVGSANVGFNMNEDSVANLAGGMAAATVAAKKQSEEEEKKVAVRFPKLDLVDRKYMHYVEPKFDNEMTLEQFCQGRIFKQFINLIDARQQTFIMLPGDLYKVQVVGGHSLAVNNIRNDQGNLTFG